MLSSLNNVIENLLIKGTLIPHFNGCVIPWCESSESVSCSVVSNSL